MTNKLIKPVIDNSDTDGGEGMAEVRRFRHKLLEEYLAKLTDSHQAGFHRIYPKGLAEEHYIHAFRQIEKALKGYQEPKEGEGIV
jgi:hypothetical protein